MLNFYLYNLLILYYENPNCGATSGAPHGLQFG